MQLGCIKRPVRQATVTWVVLGELDKELRPSEWNGIAKEMFIPVRDEVGRAAFRVVGAVVDQISSVSHQPKYAVNVHRK